jgi:hypothetical protein
MMMNELNFILFLVKVIKELLEMKILQNDFRY